MKMPLLSEEAAGPRVKLIAWTAEPYNLAIASARTCYSAKGIVEPQQVAATEKSRELRDRIARSTLKAGHLTTRQHPHFVFSLDHVSRHLVWSFLHSHPYYNSEQVSQRYVEVKDKAYYIPPGLHASGRQKALSLFTDTISSANDCYHEFIDLLNPVVSQEYFQIFPGRRKNQDAWSATLKRKAMEVARYVLPTAAHTYLYHTINGLTLHRYYRLCMIYDVPHESRLLARAMYEEVKRVDPLYASEMQDPLPLEQTLEYTFFEQMYGLNDSGKIRWNHDAAGSFVHEFDHELNSRSSVLADYGRDTVRLLSDSFRATAGLPRESLSDSDCIEFLLNPEKNKHLQATLNESSVSTFTRNLQNIRYVFRKKLSHTADSQDQRHRLVPGARPVLMTHYSGEPDYITPGIISCNPFLKERYDVFMNKHFESIEQFLELGGEYEEAVYLLPNAFPIRFFESGDLMNLHHKWKSRLCYNAQEEIFRASVDELQAVKRVDPEIARWIGPPCKLRLDASVKPYCPEGDRYCGVPVWKFGPEDYIRIL